jgi:hypothetical protein
VDEALSEAMSGISNRSDFIRSAILYALGNVCPLCSGSGTISVSQRNHWDGFTRHHHLTTCSDCNDAHLVCDHEIHQ